MDTLLLMEADLLPDESVRTANAFELEMKLDLEGKVQAARSGTPTSARERGRREERNRSRSRDRSSSSHSTRSKEEDEKKKANDATAGVAGTSKGELSQLSNDDLFYDPQIDAENERWVQSHRARYQPAGCGRPPTSDAVLNCPACMSLLCLDCQRHDVYKHQYRAMFVTNCEVDFFKVLTVPEGSRKQRKGRRKKKAGGQEEEEGEPKEDDRFHPVRCRHCVTVVGMLDRDEVYHFFNVLASHA